MTEHLDIGRVFSAIAELYKNNLAVLLGVAFVIFLVLAVLTGLLIVVSPLLLLITGVVAFVAQYWYQGMVIELVNRVHAGGAVPGVGELFSAVGPRLGRLIAAGLLAGLGIVIGFILLIVPGLYLITIWAVIAPVIVIEGAAIGASFGRSQQLVKGDGWPVFGVLFILFVLNLVIGVIVQIVFGSGNFVGAFLGSLIPNLLLAPVSALAAAVIYFELRRLKEGGGVTGAPAAAGMPGGQPAYPPAQPPAYPQQPGSQPPPGGPYQQPPPGSPPGGPYQQPPPGSPLGG